MLCWEWGKQEEGARQQGAACPLVTSVRTWVLALSGGGPSSPCRAEVDGHMKLSVQG